MASNNFHMAMPENGLLVMSSSCWQQSWDQQISNKLHSIKPMICPWPVPPVRGFDVKLNRFCTGHTRVTHKPLLFGVRCPTCASCHAALTILHILVECPIFNNHRLLF
ncbi:hypothetical protein AVEN_22577-1 [Araneus ventricosus]|uniref:Reverse transcriptase zinc-binding domain-containing protein n=1 Tax=Araneus ventricosus TaxID=182803 RepID=A0A4Y2E7D4_ARAVE|nr:hypothetical protein AVEN_22577-1 [Araneus ventricosus]